MTELYRLIDLNTLADDRGKLTAIEATSDIPMEIHRVFYMHHINDNRGGHAHIDTDQTIIAVHGSFNITLNNGNSKEVIYIDNPMTGLYVPRLTFTDFSEISSDAVILVLANTHYDYTKSLRSFDDFINYLNTIKGEK